MKRSHKPLPALALIVLVSLAPLSEGAELENFDRRRENQSQESAVSAERQAAVEETRTRIPGLIVDFDDLLGTPVFVISRESFLTPSDEEEDLRNPKTFEMLAREAATPADLYRPVKRFLEENQKLFGHGAEVLEGARITRDHVTQHNGVRTVVWEQQLDEIPVFEALFVAHIARNGGLLNVSSRLLPNPEGASGLSPEQRASRAASPAVPAREAIVHAALALEEPIEASRVEVESTSPEGASREQELTGNFLRGRAKAELVWLPIDRLTARLCWTTTLTGAVRREPMNVLVDAETGKVWVRQRLSSAATPSYRVFFADNPKALSPGYSTPITTEPYALSRVLLPLESLYPGGDPWMEVTETRTIGNNVDARTDLTDTDPAYDEDLLPPNMRPENANRIFDFPLNLSQDPSTYREAAVVNAFFWCNYAHDRFYDLGFNEGAWNFQQSNYGRGGVEGDAMLVDVQNRALDSQSLFQYNDARFISTSGEDGTPGRLHIPVFNSPTPYRDAAFDAEMILHEYTHGVSERLVGKGSKLSHEQSAGLGEGWSDFFALALLAEETDNLHGNYAFGAYSVRDWTQTAILLENNYYFGWRRYPYTTDMELNPVTFKDIDPLQASPYVEPPYEEPYTYVAPRNPGLDLDVTLLNGEPFIVLPSDKPHFQGEIWCSALWQMRVNLIETLGYEDGNFKALQIVLDGMNFAPPNPNFIQARDGVLQADQVNNGGANLREIWSAFAKRGMGYSATAPESTTTEGVAEAFDLPPSGDVIWSYAAGDDVSSSPAIAADGTIYVGSVDKKVHAINPDGSGEWTFYPAGVTPWSFRATPAVDDSDGTIYIGSYGWMFYAINPDGSEKWRYTTTGQVHSSPTVGPDGIYFGAMDSGKIYALNKNGTLKWGPVSTGNTIYSSPALSADGWVYIGSMDNKVYALSAATGAVKTGWPFTTGGWVYSSPAIGADGSISVGSYDDKLYALNPNGTKKWEALTGGDIQSSPVIGLDGTIYVGANDNKLYAFNPANGILKWDFEPLSGFMVQSTAAVTGDGTVILGSGGSLYWIEAATGTLIDSKQMSGGLFSSPAIGNDGRVYIGVTGLNPGVRAIENVAGLAQSAWPLFRKNLRRTGH